VRRGPRVFWLHAGRDQGRAGRHLCTNRGAERDSNKGVSSIFWGDSSTPNPNPKYTCTSAPDAANHRRGAKASLITVFCHAILFSGHLRCVASFPLSMSDAVTVGVITGSRHTMGGEKQSGFSAGKNVIARQPSVGVAAFPSHDSWHHPPTIQSGWGLRQTGDGRRATGDGRVVAGLGVASFSTERES